MASWEYRNEKAPYWENERKRAKEAMNDKEVGLLGQAEASKDYDEITKKLEDKTNQTNERR